MLRSIRLCLALAAILAVTSCETVLNCQQGSGPIATETRLGNGFSSIHLELAADVLVTQASNFQITVETNENIIDLVQTNIRGSELFIEVPDGECLTNTDVDVYISLPDIQGLHIAGSGNITNDSTIMSTELSSTISGSGNISLSGISVDTIRGTITGSGSISWSSLDTAASANLIITGSGNMNAFGIKSRSVNVNISGSGNANVYALDNLDVTITGSGNVNYKGNPQINANITGSGSIIDAN